MRIGELAHRTNTTPKAIRLYEARGLLGTVARAGSYRDYGEADVARVLLIRRAQALGFRLSQLTGLPSLDSPEGWEDVAQLVANRRAAVAHERARLAALDAELALLEVELRSCDGAQATSANASAQACAAPATSPPRAPQMQTQNPRFLARV
ncbi:MAG: MerR family transcriptional regulator [Acidovorax sp.]|nr:MAG: MerR family transcriptional regulator [Acidovorax sp.]